MSKTTTAVTMPGSAWGFADGNSGSGGGSLPPPSSPATAHDTGNGQFGLYDPDAHDDGFPAVLEPAVGEAPPPPTGFPAELEPAAEEEEAAHPHSHDFDFGSRDFDFGSHDVSEAPGFETSSSSSGVVNFVPAVAVVAIAALAVLLIARSCGRGGDPKRTQRRRGRDAATVTARAYAVDSPPPVAATAVAMGDGGGGGFSGGGFSGGGDCGGGGAF